ncbi:uncharacterized protein LOC124268109 [Haliotis rubra]|uniref:uncharacterized protein LOC124268109 n=1 Tax=Haliotis rubra TaxID=36100 RepID=UPI001EE56E55|nr:uncharacterized protein LOC124268109 [Haliotis rubra]
MAASMNTGPSAIHRFLIGESADPTPCIYVYTMMTLSLFPLLLALTVVDTQSPPPLPCTDYLPNCGAYKETACTGDYESWARVHCAHRCGFCGAPAGSMDNSNVLG